jgi:hypothetical protein
MITSLPSIAILIDCWKSPVPGDALSKCFNNIINFLDATESITTVVLATYNCKTERYTPNSIWADNNMSLFSNPTRKKIIDLKLAFDLLYANSINNFKPEQTDPIIWNYLHPAKYQVAMYWWWELEYYLLLHPEIKNIYFFGMAWEGCVRYRPLGYEAVIEEAPHLNILTNDKCILSEVHSAPTYIENDLNWKSIDNDIYLYQPTSLSI